MKLFATSALIAAASVFATAATAASTSEQLAMCAAELESRGVASSDDYRPEFKGISGGGTKKLTLKMKPISDGKEPVTATCKIKRGQVTDVVVKA